MRLILLILIESHILTVSHIARIFTDSLILLIIISYNWLLKIIEVC